MDAVPQLTNCFFQQFVDNKAAPDEAPVLQVLEARPMQGQANQILARFSDGIFSYGGCTITPVIIGRFRADGIGSHNAIIQVTNWKRAQLTGKVLFNVLDYNLVSLDFPVIGNPQAHSGNPNDYRQHMQSQAYVQQQQQMISTKQEPENSNAWGASTTPNSANKRGRGSSPSADSRQPLSKRQPQQAGAGGASMAGLVPIEFITPYCSKWRICGIVSAKDPQIKEITNAKGTFRVFGFVITDQAGTSIRVSAFGDIADKVFPEIQNGQVYYVSGGGNRSVRAANRNFNNTGHDYELTLDRESEVTYCEENFTAPKLKLKPVLLSLLPQRVNECVDVQAIVERMGDITQVTSRKDQRQLDKRDVFLVDKSGTEICFTLWGDQAQDFNICPGNVIGIKGALVREFNGGYSISTGSGAQIIDNPENECTQQLYLWYRDQKPLQEMRTLSTTGDSSVAFERDFHLIGPILQYGIDQESEKGQYFFVKAFVNTVKSEQMVYQACPTKGCKKKVTFEGGMYRCEKCNANFDTFTNVVMLHMEIADYTGTVWVTVFDDLATVMLQASGDELAHWQKEDRARFDAAIEHIMFREYLFRVRARYEIYNDQQQLKMSVYDVKPPPLDKCKQLYNKTFQELQQLQLL